VAAWIPDCLWGSYISPAFQEPSASEEDLSFGQVGMAALFLVFVGQPKSLSQVLGCIEDHMALGLMTMVILEDQVLVQLIVDHHHIEDQVQ